MGRMMAKGTGSTSRAMNPATRTWISPALFPTEKSNSPQTRGIMMARARMPE